ncbi:ATP-binding protein, partial [Nanoarchaeota archaeon]
VQCVMRNISQRKKAEEEVIKTRDYLNNLLQSATEYSIISCDMDKNIIFYGKGSKIIFGWEEKEVIGKKKVYDLHRKQDRHTLLPKVFDIVNKKGKFEGEVIFVHKNGKKFPGTLTITPLKENGKTIGYEGITKDLTLFRQAEQKLKESNIILKRQIERSELLNKLSRLMSSSLERTKLITQILNFFIKELGYSDARVYLHDPNRNVLYCIASHKVAQEHWSKLIRPMNKKESVTAEAFLEKKIINVPDVTARPVKYEIIKKFIDLKAYVALPLILRKKAIGCLVVDYDPEKHSMSQREITTLSTIANYIAYAINNSELYKKVKSFNEALKSKVAEDTIELKRKNLQLNKVTALAIREKNKVEAIIDSMSEGVIVVYNNPATVALNPTAEDILGLSQTKFNAEYTLQKLKALGFFKLFQEAEKKKDEVFLKDITLDYPEKKVLRTSITTLRDKKKTAIGTVTVLRDITIFKEIEEMKTGFISTVSHELRTPLTSIKGYTSLLLGENLGTLNEEQKESLTIIEEESTRLTSLINDVLDLSKLEAGRVNLEISLNNIDELIMEMINQMKVLAEQKKIKIDYRKKEIQRFRFDKIKISQVLLNLLDNAIKFTTEKGSITVKAWQANDFMKVSVSDNGRGIAGTDLPKLFDKFYQAKTHMTRDHKGTGLGLAIVKQIIDLHNGKIHVKSTPNKGSTFIFSIPLKEKAKKSK